MALMPDYQSMRDVYDRYFLSRGYRERYPRPNARTFDFLLANGAKQADRILDFGCGNGRYALPLLGHTQATLTGYDISSYSLDEFESELQRTPYRDRVVFSAGDWRIVERNGPYDLAMMLFGVLSHIGDQKARIAILSRLRRQIHPKGRLILSVPSRLRRRPLEQLSYGLRRSLRLAPPPLDEPGSILFTRKIRSEQLTFFYHLYTLQSLKAELASAGFAFLASQAESLFPEWQVTQSSAIAKIDACLADFLPPALGYGILAVAEPA